MLVHANAFRIAASEQSRSGRGADRGSHHEAREFSPFLCNAVDVWRANGFRSKTAQVSIALIISEYDNEIWFSGLRDSGGC